MFGPHVDRVHAGGGGRPTIAAHVRAARAAAAAADFDARAFQVFVAGPRGYASTLRPGEADELRAYLDGPAGRALTVVAHGTYLDFPWHGNPRAVESIRAELAACRNAGLSGLVVHLGKPGIKEVVAHLPRLIAAASGEAEAAEGGAAAAAEGGAAAASGEAEGKAEAAGRGVLIYLETPHVKPANSHYETPEKLADLFRGVRGVDPGLCHFGLCIDTAHLWSCGADIQSFEAAEGWLRRLEAAADVIPPDRILVHLNDSLDARGSGVDHHAPLLRGKIWGEYADRPRQSGLAAFVDWIVRHGVAAILERKPPAALLDDYAILDRLTDEVRLAPP